MNQYAVNPQGEVAEFDGQGWKPVDKARVARNDNGDISVFNGSAWTPLNKPDLSQRLQNNPYSKAVEDVQGSAGPEVGRQLGLTARYTLEGLSVPAEIIGNAANAAVNLGTRGINAAAGTNIPRLESFTEGRDKALDVLPKPQTAPERVVGQAAKFVASVPAFAGTAAAGAMAGTDALSPMGERLLQQTVGAGTGGAAYGGAKETTDNPWLQLGAAVLGGAAGSGATAAIENAARPGAAAVPSTEAIRQSATAAYRQADEAGAVLRPEAIQNLQRTITTELADSGYHPDLQPRVAVVLRELERTGQQNITAGGVDVLRKLARSVATSADPSERRLGGIIINQIDDMMANLRPEDVVQGNAQEATQAFGQARDLWRTYRKSELIDNLVQKGEDQGLSTNSGGNIQNTIRQKLRTLLDNPRNARMFTEEEQAAIRQVVRGTPTQNGLRLLGRLAPSSNAWLGVLSTFAAPGVGIAVPIIGAAAKAAATRSTENSVNALSEMIRGGAASEAANGAPPLSLQQMMARILMQGSNALTPNAYSGALLRSGGVPVPASGSPNRGSPGGPR